MSLRLKVMAIVLGLALLMGTGASVEMRRSLVTQLDEEMEVGVVGVARTIASSLATFSERPDLDLVKPALWRVQRVNPDVRYVRVLRSDGILIADTLPYHLQQHVTFSAIDSPRQPFQVRRFRTAEERVREVSLPIDGGWGIVQVGMSETRMNELVTQATGRFLRAMTFIALLGVAVAAVVTHWMTTPIVRLARIARDVERGDRTQRASLSGSAASAARRSFGRDEVGRLCDAFDAMLDSLEKALGRNESLLDEVHEKERMRVELLRQLFSAQEDERRRVARELHDETAQLLASLLAGLSVITHATTDPAMQTRAKDLIALTEQTMASLRQIALQLRPEALESLGLVPALRQRVDEYVSRFGFSIELETVGLDEARFPLEVESALYRIILEAMTNAVRHAQPDHLSIVLERRTTGDGEDQTDLVVAVVEDDGRGFDIDRILSRAPRQRLGLFGMRERAELVGGKLTIESAEGAGTTIVIECPLKSDET